jgi:hypothetical protein
MKSAPGRPITVLNGLWVLVFLFEASFKGDDRGHQIGALALGILFTTLIVAELRSYRSKPLRSRQLADSDH